MASTSASLVHAGKHYRRFDPSETLDPDDPAVKRDLIAIIHHYLESEGFSAAAVTLRDEADLRTSVNEARIKQFQQLQRAVMDGSWAKAWALATKQFFRRHHANCEYALLVQQFLEAVDGGDQHRAYTLLTERLKPLEHASAVRGSADFRSLCYLLTCKRVHDAPGFKSWTPHSGRASLVEQLRAMLELDVPPADRGAGTEVPHRRLETLLQQAVAFQVDSARYHPRLTPRVTSLLHDFRSVAVPNAALYQYQGHEDNIKCVDFVGESGLLLASGSSDSTVRLWVTDAAHWTRKPEVEDEEGASGEAETSAGTAGAGSASRAQSTALLQAQAATPRFVERRCARLRGHASRVWDVASDRAGRLLASACGSGHVLLWALAPATEQLLAVCGAAQRVATSTVGAGDGDGECERKSSEDETDASDACASVALRSVDGTVVGRVPSAAAAAGAESLDLDASQCGVSRLVGHAGDVYTVAWHPRETHVGTGGYDRTVRLWDVTRTEPLRAFEGHNASVSQAVFNSHGNLLVSGSKDSTIKFWDALSGVCVSTLSQHLGEVTSVAISPCGTKLLSASKDNSNRVWDIRMGRPLQKLRGHQNTARNFVRCAFGPGDLVLSGSEDGRVCVWDAESGTLLQRLRGHTGCAYRAVWNESQSIVASCSHDGTVRTWWWDSTAPYDGGAVPQL